MCGEAPFCQPWTTFATKSVTNTGFSVILGVVVVCFSISTELGIFETICFVSFQKGGICWISVDISYVWARLGALLEEKEEGLAKIAWHPPEVIFANSYDHN